MPSRTSLVILGVLAGQLFGIAGLAQQRQNSAGSASSGGAGTARVDMLLNAGNSAIAVNEYTKKSNSLLSGFTVTADEIAACNAGKADACAQAGDAFGRVKSKSGEPGWLAVPDAATGGCWIGRREVCDQMIQYAELFWARACVLNTSHCGLLGKEFAAKGDIAAERHLYEASGDYWELAGSYESAEPRDPEKAAALFTKLCVGGEVKPACERLIALGKDDARIEESLGRIQRRDCGQHSDWKLAEQACGELIAKRSDDTGAGENLKAAQLAEREFELEQQIEFEVSAAVSEERQAIQEDTNAMPAQNHISVLHRDAAASHRTEAERHRKSAERLQKELDSLAQARP